MRVAHQLPDHIDPKITSKGLADLRRTAGEREEEEGVLSMGGGAGGKESRRGGHRAVCGETIMSEEPTEREDEALGESCQL